MHGREIIVRPLKHFRKWHSRLYLLRFSAALPSLFAYPLTWQKRTQIDFFTRFITKLCVGSTLRLALQGASYQDYPEVSAYKRGDANDRCADEEQKK